MGSEYALKNTRMLESLAKLSNILDIHEYV